MRSSLAWSNHQASSPATQADAFAYERLPSLSFATAPMTMLPETGGFIVQNTRPLSSVLPWQVESSFLICAPLS